jgi:DNA-binding beta-propeller fold protein YncE
MMKALLTLALGVAAFAAGPRRIDTLIGNGQVNNPYGLVIGPDGALYICEIGNHRVSRLDLKTKKLTTVVGTGEKGNSGDGGPATKAQVNEPYEIRFDRRGNMFFVDMPSHVVRRVDRKTKVITTVVGTGKPGFSGDGGLPAKAELRQPHSIAFDLRGRLLICDIGNHRIRRVDLAANTIETYAGTGERQPTPEGALVIGTPLNGPRAIAVDPLGNLYVALREGNAVYKIDAATEKYTHIAGTGKQGYAGDGGPAVKALLSGPKGISWSRDGGVYIADTESHTIRRIDLKSGLIGTVVGTGQRGDGPDGDPLQCRMSRPHGVYVDSKGMVYISDSEAHRVRWLK